MVIVPLHNDDTNAAAREETKAEAEKAKVKEAEAEEAKARRVGAPGRRIRI